MADVETVIDRPIWREWRYGLEKEMKQNQRAILMGMLLDLEFLFHEHLPVTVQI